MDWNSTTWLTGAGIAAGFAALGAFWRQARNFFTYLSSFVLLQKGCNGNISTVVALYLRKNYKKLPSGLSRYIGVTTNLDDGPINSIVPFEMPMHSSVWIGPCGWFFVTYGSEAGPSLKLVSLRFLSNPKQLVKDAIKYCTSMLTSEEGRNFRIIKMIGSAGDLSFKQGQFQDGSHTSSNRPDNSSISVNAPDDLWSQPNFDIDKSFMYPTERYLIKDTKPDPFKGLFFDDNIKDLVKRLKYWYDQRDWYTSHGIPWRTGVLFHGPGGTGKSSLAKAIAQTLGLPLVQFYMNTFSDKEFSKDWDNLPVPCVVVLEDIDTVFHGRKPMTVHKSLSFECVLNQISGVNSLNGVLLIVTTNLLDKVDPALGQLDVKGRPTRPGRIDYIVELDRSSENQRQKIASYIFKDWAFTEIDELVKSGEGTTVAQFQSMCCQHATLLKFVDSNIVNDRMNTPIV